MIFQGPFMNFFSLTVQNLATRCRQTLPVVWSHCGRLQLNHKRINDSTKVKLHICAALTKCFYFGFWVLSKGEWICTDSQERPHHFSVPNLQNSWYVKSAWAPVDSPLLLSPTGPGTGRDISGSPCVSQSLWLLLASFACLFFKC